MNASTALSVGLTAAGPAVQAIGDVKKGKGIVPSLGKAALDFAVSDVVTGLLGFWPSMALSLGGSFAAAGVKAGIEAGQNKARKVGKLTSPAGQVGGGYFKDNEYAATMRQRSLEAIGGHQQMTRNALGSEARRRAAYINY